MGHLKDNIIVHNFSDVETLAKKSASFLWGNNVAISGGATYRTCLPYWKINDSEKLQDKVFIAADERLVPFTDEGSNWRMIYETFLKPNHLDEHKDYFFSDLGKANKVFNELVLPRGLDQVFLGLGADGHTCSLFPGGQELQNENDWLVESTAPFAPHNRISLGLKALWQANELVLIAYGDKKIPVLIDVLEEKGNHPLAKVLGRAKKVVLLTVNFPDKYCN